MTSTHAHIAGQAIAPDFTESITAGPGADIAPDASAATNSTADEYDYVVVGAGTAGSVIAARLSEDPTIRVLIVEAGAVQPQVDITDPVSWPRLAGTSVDWSDRTAAQPQLHDTRLPWPHGHVLGGSSAINGLMHIRGDRSAIDAWEVGAPGWNADALEPYYRRSETVSGATSERRGHGGPMQISVSTGEDPLWEACFEAAVQAGHAANPDSNADLGEGVSWNETTVLDGRRQTAADAYLRPVLGRTNLAVVTDALVERLQFDGDRCRGIVYQRDGRSFEAIATEEVVLTAGAIGTPQLLMLSGIGPAAHLRDVDVPVVLDLPGVGSNLQDHPKSQVAYTATSPVRTGRFARKPHVLAGTTPDGPLDVQMIFIEAPVAPRWTPEPRDGYSVIFSIMDPHSRGTVRLQDGNPQSRPVIDPGYLSDARDIDRMVQALRMARRVGDADALRDLRGHEVYPGPSTDDDDLAEYIRQTLTSYFHPVGTCRIGNDSMAVVDPDLRLHGCSGVRIADASVMPSLPSGNTNATVLAIAERAAEMILRARPDIVTRMSSPTSRPIPAG